MPENYDLEKLVRSKNEEGVKAALAQGADANVRGSTGQTMLSTAVSRGSTPILKLLLDHGADPHLKEPQGGNTLLHMAAAYNAPEKVIDLLMGAGLDINV